MLGFESRSEVKITTGAIVDAVWEAKIGIGEDRLREMISAGMVPTVQIGNRNYLAMEMFSPPFDRLFNADAYVYKDREPIQTRRKKYSEEQLSELLKRANKEAVMCRI